MPNRLQEASAVRGHLGGVDARALETPTEGATMTCHREEKWCVTPVTWHEAVHMATKVTDLCEDGGPGSLVGRVEYLQAVCLRRCPNHLCLRAQCLFDPIRHALQD